jgi:glycosyltransferase involved in cell wall biosynthesis
MDRVYRSEFNAPGSIIPYCWNSMDALGDQQDVLQEAGLTRNGYFVLAGRLVPENNIEAIVEAYVSGDLDLPIVVLGEANYDSPSARALTRLANQDSRVRVFGHIRDRAAFGAILRDASALIHGHSVGGTNPGLVEAMGVGALIVALDTPFNRETLGGAAEYFGTPSNVTAALARALVRDEELRVAARTRAAERFDLQSIADAYEVLLTEVAAGRVARGEPVPTRWSTGVAL